MSTTYRVGRGTEADIVVDDKTVSRDHADLIASADGGYYWIDRNSSNGSFHQREGRWIKLIKGYVTGDEPIKLGSFETTVARLLAGSSSKSKQRPVEDAVHGGGHGDHKKGIVGAVERDSFGIPRPKK